MMAINPFLPLLIFMIFSLVSSNQNFTYNFVNGDLLTINENVGMGNITTVNPIYSSLLEDQISTPEFLRLKNKKTVKKIFSIIEKLSDVYHDVGLIEKCSNNTNWQHYKNFKNTVEALILKDQVGKEKSRTYSYPAKELISSLDSKIYKCSFKDKKINEKIKFTAKHLLQKMNPGIIEYLEKHIPKSENINNEFLIATFCKDSVFCVNDLKKIFRRIIHNMQRYKRNSENEHDLTNTIKKRQGHSSDHYHDYDYNHSKNTYYAVADTQREVGIESILLGKLLGSASIGALGIMGLLSYRILYHVINNEPEVGEHGDKGLMGNKGMKGDKSKKGDFGMTGDQGLIGDLGDKGNKGNHGVIGEKGKMGRTNIIKGIIGERGEEGEKGMNGEKGEKGMNGEKGVKGEKGMRGTRGMLSEKGETRDNKRNRMKRSLNNLYSSWTYYNGRKVRDANLIETVNKMWADESKSNQCCSLYQVLVNDQYSDLDKLIITSFARIIDGINASKMYNEIKLEKKRYPEMICEENEENSCNILFV